GVQGRAVCRHRAFHSPGFPVYRQKSGSSSGYDRRNYSEGGGAAHRRAEGEAAGSPAGRYHQSADPGRKQGGSQGNTGRTESGAGDSAGGYRGGCAAGDHRGGTSQNGTRFSETAEREQPRFCLTKYFYICRIMAEDLTGSRRWICGGLFSAVSESKSAGGGSSR